MIIAGKIKRLEDWYYKAGPKDLDTQWADDHSAKEFAKLWFNKDKVVVNHEIQNAIRSVDSEFQIHFTFPEHITDIDDIPGGQRNHDMMIYGKSLNNDGIVCIEAKATEGLDEIISKKLHDVENNRKSRLPERIKNLTEYFNINLNEALDLRYQLFTGIYGTIVEAEKLNVNKCIFMILQLRTRLTKSYKIKENREDIESFLNTILRRTDIKIMKDLFSIEIPIKSNVKTTFLYLEIDKKK